MPLLLPRKKWVGSDTVCAKAAQQHQHRQLNSNNSTGNPLPLLLPLLLLHRLLQQRPLQRLEALERVLLLVLLLLLLWQLHRKANILASMWGQMAPLRAGPFKHSGQTPNPKP